MNKQRVSKLIKQAKRWAHDMKYDKQFQEKGEDINTAFEIVDSLSEELI